MNDNEAFIKIGCPRNTWEINLTSWESGVIPSWRATSKLVSAG
jgi:hypothetical protein